MFQRSDDGFSLVEVIIAMFLLAILSLAVLPLIIGATNTSVVNRDTAAATAFANSQLALLRDQYPLTATSGATCSSLVNRTTTAAAAGAGSSAAGMTAKVIVRGTCPTSFPSTMVVDIVVEDATGAALVTIPTLIKVRAA